MNRPDSIQCLLPQVVFDLRPLRSGFTFWNVAAVMYLSIFTAYWLYNLVHTVLELRAVAAIRAFTTDKLGLSERQLRAVTWPEVVSRIVQVSWRLCLLLRENLQSMCAALCRAALPSFWPLEALLMNSCLGNLGKNQCER